MVDIYSKDKNKLTPLGIAATAQLKKVMVRENIQQLIQSKQSLEQMLGEINKRLQKSERENKD